MKPASWTSETWSRAVVGYAALALLPPVLVLVVLAAKFQGLQSPAAMDQAQVARHLAQGEGFTTSLIRPLSLVFRADLSSHPDLYNPPVQPLVLALFYRLIHLSEKVMALVGGGFWVLSVWLTFGVARRWLEPGPAALATFFYGCNPALLLAALNGLPQPLMALGLLSVVGLAFPPPRDKGKKTPFPRWRLVATGAACALATLTHYLLGLFALIVVLHVVLSQREKQEERVGTPPAASSQQPAAPVIRHPSLVTRHSSLGWWLVGFLIPLLPWMARNVLLVRSPVFSLYWYEALAHTDTYPGESLWRTAEPPPSPLAFMIRHPLQMLRKLLVGFHQFFTAAPNLINPVVGFLFLVALWEGEEERRWRALLGIIGVSLALCGVASCLLRPEPALLLAWEPFLALFAVRALVTWLPHRIKPLAWGGMTLTLPRFRWLRRAARPTVNVGGGVIAAHWLRAGGYLIAGGLVLFPLLAFLSLEPPGPRPVAADVVAPLSRVVSKQATVLTDQPAWVAWYADRRAVWLFQKEEDWTRVERSLGPVDAAYITQAITQIPAEERSDWWFWLASPQGIYRQLAPVEPSPPQAVLRVRVGKGEPKGTKGN